MKAIRFRIEAGRLAEAEAILTHYLRGLDVQLLSFRSDSVLLAPHLNLHWSSNMVHGVRLASSTLAGLSDGTQMEWEGAFRWAHARVWDREASKAIEEKKADQLDWHLRMCEAAQET